MDKDIIIRNFSRYAHLYDQYANVQKLTAIDLFRRLKDLKCKNILELGCGTGNFTALLAVGFPGAGIKAVDIADKMLEVAQVKVKYKNIDFILADCEKISFPGKFDLITSNASIQWINDLETAVQKYKSLLAENGRIAFSVFGPQTYKELSSTLKIFKQNLIFNADNFLSRKDVKRIFKNEFKKFSLQKKIYHEDFASLNDLLKSIKYTGTRGEGLNGKLVLSQGKIKQLEEIYLKKFKRIRANYEVFFCEAKI